MKPYIATMLLTTSLFASTTRAENGAASQPVATPVSIPVELRQLNETLYGIQVSIQHLIESQNRALLFKRVEFAAFEEGALSSDLRRLREKRQSAQDELAFLESRLDTLADVPEQGLVTAESAETARQRRQMEEVGKLLKDRLRAIDREINELQNELTTAKRDRSLWQEQLDRD